MALHYISKYDILETLSFVLILYSWFSSSVPPQTHLTCVHPGWTTLTQSSGVPPQTPPICHHPRWSTQTLSTRTLWLWTSSQPAIARPWMALQLTALLTTASTAHGSPSQKMMWSELTNWGQNRMANILQMTFLNAFSCKTNFQWQKVRLLLVMAWCLPGNYDDLNLWSHIDGSGQERRNSIASALELHLSCTNPLVCPLPGSMVQQTQSADSKSWSW